MWWFAGIFYSYFPKRLNLELLVGKFRFCIFFLLMVLLFFFCFNWNTCQELAGFRVWDACGWFSLKIRRWSRNSFPPLPTWSVGHKERGAKFIWKYKLKSHEAPPHLIHFVVLWIKQVFVCCAVTLDVLLARLTKHQEWQIVCAKGSGKEDVQGELFTARLCWGQGICGLGASPLQPAEQLLQGPGLSWVSCFHGLCIHSDYKPILKMNHQSNFWRLKWQMVFLSSSL